MMMDNNIVEILAVSLMLGAPFVIGLAYIIISAIGANDQTRSRSCPEIDDGGAGF